jgi:hypothetical protein
MMFKVVASKAQDGSAVRQRTSCVHTHLGATSCMQAVIGDGLLGFYALSNARRCDAYIEMDNKNYEF